MLFYKNLEDIVFHRHKMFEGIDEMIILSGYLGPHPIKKLEQLPFKCKIIYGMYGVERIKNRLHSTLKNLNSEIKNIDILYSKIAVHSKCYVWKKKGNIVTALVGSANFSRNGLDTPYREILAETTYDTFNPLNEYLDYIIDNSLLCTDDNIELRKSNQLSLDEKIKSDICKISFLVKGDVPKSSGINWGCSSGHTSEGDAYIKISTQCLKEYPNLFPPKREAPTKKVKGARCFRQNDEVEFIFDDGTIMSGILEGNGVSIDGKVYPKQMCSSPKKNILGKYLRKRMGLSNDKVITVEDFKRYGRSDIEVSLLSEGVYFLNFSTK